MRKKTRSREPRQLGKLAGAATGLAIVALLFLFLFKPAEPFNLIADINHNPPKYVDLDPEKAGIADWLDPPRLLYLGNHSITVYGWLQIQETRNGTEYYLNDRGEKIRLMFDTSVKGNEPTPWLKGQWVKAVGRVGWLGDPFNPMFIAQKVENA